MWRLDRGYSIAAAVLIAATAVFQVVRHPSPEQADSAERAEASRLMGELMSGKAAVGGPFSLTDQHGRKTSLADFRGKLVLLYFGYTFCPDVCPTDLLAIAQTMKALGADADHIQPIFVTLDPARDTPEVLRNYTAAFDPRIVALHGTETEIRAVATAYKVFFRKVTPPGARFYLIDHSAYTFFLDREGKYVAFAPPGTTAERLAVMVRAITPP